MHKKQSRFTSNVSFIEPLESRTLMSADPTVVAIGSLADVPAIHADAKAAKETTKTIVKVSKGTLSQPITFTVTVQTAVKFAAPFGTVNILVNGSSVEVTTIAPISQPNSKIEVSEATYTIPGGVGGEDYSIGHHPVAAIYTSTGAWLGSVGKTTLVVSNPKYVHQSDGLKIASLGGGSGPGITAGQTATMEYTGYLAKNGSIFDDSDAHSPGTFSFTVDASPEAVIPGFDQGTIGMQAGETRILYIPYKLGYGTTAVGTSIPAKSNLIFLIKLVSIS